MKAMLYRDAEPWYVDSALGNDTWVAEPKYNGVRCLVYVTEGYVTLFNRNGKPLAAGAAATRNKVRRDLTTAFYPLTGAWWFDGELVDDTIWLFDMIEGGNGFIGGAHPFCTRSLALDILFNDDRLTFPSTVRRAEQAKTTAEKKALLERIKAEGGEGIMLKKNTAPYYPGKRPSGVGFKVKLTKDADFVVTAVGVDGKENAALSIYKRGALVEVGAASTIGKGEVNVGDVVEARYLYIGPNGRLVQPRILRVRTDKVASECTIDQIAA